MGIMMGIMIASKQFHFFSKLDRSRKSMGKSSKTGRSEK